MMSLGAIKQLAREHAEQAAEEGLKPFVYFNEAEVDEFDHFPFPFLGDYEPDGWERTDREHFVDASGFGQPGEPALTVDEFRDLIRDRVRTTRGVGWAITEAGQFQVFVTEYQRT